MSIVSSTYETLNSMDAGRNYIRESHTDSTGKVHQIIYLAADGFDCAARMAANAESLAQSLADQEAEALTNG